MLLDDECFEYGFHELEKDGTVDFRWCSFEASLCLPDLPEKYLHIDLYSDFSDFSQVVECVIDNTFIKTLHLIRGWNTYVIPRGEGKHLIFRTNKKIDAPADSRIMTMRLGPIDFSDISENPKNIISENILLNNKEFTQGKTILDSYPVQLGIDIYGVCNMRPACVYCEYDDVKRKEGSYTYAPFNKKTLEEYGNFFTHCKQLTNCSIGEPFLSPYIGELLDEFEKNGKVLEISTNGLLLTEKNRALLLGKNIKLYISIDAATPETYAKLRTDSFDIVIDNVRALAKERAHASGPSIYMVFMPMRVNIHELEDFIKLCADIKTDLLILRPLLESSILSSINRGGHVFDYFAEKFTREEFIQISINARALSKKYGVKLADQLNFGGSIEKDLKIFKQHAVVKQGTFVESHTPEVSKTGLSLEEKKEEHIPVTTITSSMTPVITKKPPICREPWETSYILRAGVKFCCYSFRPLGPMDKFKELWNCERIQGIRSRLAQGEFSKYCLESKSCPLVRKHLAEHPEREVKTINDIIPRKVHQLYQKLVR